MLCREEGFEREKVWIERGSGRKKGDGGRRASCVNWRLQVIRKQQAAAQVAAAMLLGIVGTCSKQTGSVYNNGWKSVTY